MGMWLLFWEIGAIVSILASIFANPGMILFAGICSAMVFVTNKSKKNGK